jgi:hypothetical protein
VNKLSSRLSVKQIQKLCNDVKPILLKHYTKPADEMDLDDYEYNEELFRIIQESRKLVFIRAEAAKKKVDPISYYALENRAYKLLRENQLAENHLYEWMLSELDRLPIMEWVPETPDDFKLEDFLLRHAQIQIS